MNLINLFILLLIIGLIAELVNVIHRAVKKRKTEKMKRIITETYNRR